MHEQALVDLERERAKEQQHAHSASFIKEKMELEEKLKNLTEKVCVLPEVGGSSSSILQVEPIVTAGSGIETIKESIGFDAIVSGVARESASSIGDEAADEGSTMLVATMTKLFKVQTEVMAAQQLFNICHH